VIEVKRLRNVGNATVTAAIESWLWAATHTERSDLAELTTFHPFSSSQRRYAGALPPKTRELLKATRQLLVTKALDEVNTLETFEVRKHESYGPESALVWINFNGSDETHVFLMTRTSERDGWQRDMDARGLPGGPSAR
jgi:hypothetical protein